MRSIPLFFVLALLLNGTRTAAETSATPGYPDSWQALDPREVALLPPYCKYTQIYRNKIDGGVNAAEIERWGAIMGPAKPGSTSNVFGYLHHYCNGLLLTNRALILTRDAQWKKNYLKYSIGEFQYVIDRVPDSFKLLPEILTRQGENLIRLNQPGQGIPILERAISLKADYWPPYAALSDHYKDKGDVARARNVLEKSLSLSPDAAAIKRRLGELNGSKRKK